MGTHEVFIMTNLLILLMIALAASSIGFKKYVWFISIGYGAAIAAIGAGLLIMFRNTLTPAAIPAVMFMLYGCRLAGYLAFRELKVSSYTKNMTGEIKDGNAVSFGVKCAIWISAALLYACETCPVLFRLEYSQKTDGCLIVGILIMILGLCVETAADLQKNQAKKKNPDRFVDTGLFSFVRCPNYLGEMLFWTGTLLTGIPAIHGALSWIAALLGYIGIIYVMFSGARRLEIRQNKNYGNDPEYRNYVKNTPIMIPFIPLYSVEKYTWLVA